MVGALQAKHQAQRGVNTAKVCQRKVAEHPPNLTMLQYKQAGGPDDRRQQEANCSPVVDHKVTWLRELEPGTTARDHGEHDIAVGVVVGPSGHHTCRSTFRTLQI